MYTQTPSSSFFFVCVTFIILDFFLRNHHLRLVINWMPCRCIICTYETLSVNMEITVWLQGLEPAHEPDELGFFFLTLHSEQRWHEAADFLMWINTVWSSWQQSVHMCVCVYSRCRLELSLLINKDNIFFLWSFFTSKCQKIIVGQLTGHV